jgi:hypothetical protein
VRELFFIPDLVGELSARHQELLAAAMPGAGRRADADETFQGATDLCEWAHRMVHLDDDNDDNDGNEEEEEEGPTIDPDACEQRAVPRSKRQTEVIVINRRKKHHGGHGAAVAIGLGVGLGVGTLPPHTTQRRYRPWQRPHALGGGHCGGCLLLVLQASPWWCSWRSSRAS